MADEYNLMSMTKYHGSDVECHCFRDAFCDHLIYISDTSTHHKVLFYSKQPGLSKIVFENFGMCLQSIFSSEEDCKIRVLDGAGHCWVSSI